MEGDGGTDESGVRFDARVDELAGEAAEEHVCKRADEERDFLRDDSVDELIHEERHEGPFCIVRPCMYRTLNTWACTRGDRDVQYRLSSLPS